MPRPCGPRPSKALYDRWKGQSRIGVFATIMTDLAAQALEAEIVMTDPTQAKAYRAAAGMVLEKGGEDG